MKKLLLVPLLAAATLVSFQASAGQIKVGAVPTPHTPILEFVKPLLAKQGVELEIVGFSEAIQPNLATADGSIDANYTQHQPYLDAFVKEHGSPLVSIGGIHIEPIGLYSSKIKDIKDLKDGGKIAIAFDPANAGRSLILLQKHGLIKLKEPGNISSTVHDIVENKRNLQFIEIDPALMPRSLDDFDGAIITTNYVIEAGLNPLEDAILIEDKESPYINIIVAKKGRENDEDLKKLVSTLRTEEVRQFMLRKFRGAVVPAF